MIKSLLILIFCATVSSVLAGPGPNSNVIQFANTVGSATNVSNASPLPVSIPTGAPIPVVITSPSPVPVNIVSPVGQLPITQSIPVNLSTAQVAPKTYQNANGTFVINSGLTTVAATEAPPATAVGFVLEASSSNGANLRWAIGATATTSSGMRLEPGRDSGFVPLSANISIISESGTNEYELQWVKQ